MSAFFMSPIYHGRGRPRPAVRESLPMRRCLLTLLGCALLGCPDPPAALIVDAGPQRKVISDDVLARPPEVASATVKFVLVSWADVRKQHRDLPINARVDSRTQAQAETMALDVLDRARRGED